MKHILSVDQFDKDRLRQIFSTADNLRNSGNFGETLKGKVITNLFYEASTRTSSSFYSAAVKLGASVIPINEVTYSSVSKGESLKDTIRTLGCYSDAIVLRHGTKGAAAEAASVSTVSIINAGDGAGEHPTQALLDLYTIHREKGRVKNLKIGMLGDLYWGRTVHSLTKLLRLFDVELYFIAGRGFKMPSELVRPGDIEVEGLTNTLPKLDVLYVTRMQYERHNISKEFIDYNYQINPEMLQPARSDLTIMHPLPRVDEITEEVDKDPRAAYFRQMENGLWVRMALLKLLITGF